MTTAPDLEPEPEILELSIVEVLTIDNNISRYSLDHFYRIIINTGISKYSIAGFT